MLSFFPRVVLDEIWDLIESVSEGFSTYSLKVILLQQDNARLHTCTVAMDAEERNGYICIPYPAYSPDLAPKGFFLFPNLKKDIRDCHFRSDEEVVTAVEELVTGKDPDFFSSELMALEHRWSKCITLEGNCIDKEVVDLNRK